MEYVLITWPESQLLMEKIWFDECILMNDENHLDNIGSSAYFVPKERYEEMSNDEYLHNKELEINTHIDTDVYPATNI